MSAQFIELRRPTEPIDGAVRIPGSKSFTNRAMILAALAPGESVLSGASLSRDSEALCRAFEALAIRTEVRGDEVRVSGAPDRLTPPSGTIDVGPAGTTMRFVTSLCACIRGADITLRGSERMHQRPIGDLVEALRTLGARIDYLGTPGCPPLRIHTDAPLRGGRVRMPGHLSSQFFTSLLLVAPLLPEGLTIEVVGEQISRSYIDMTIQSLRSAGIDVEHRDYREYRVAPGQSVRAGAYSIEGDASGATYFWGVAALGGGRVRVDNVRPDSTQGDMAFPGLLERMGCRVESGADWVEVHGADLLSAIEADMSSMPDTAQTLAVIASRARGTTVLSGLSTLRHKETDRLAALETELAKVGIASETTADSITVHGAAPTAARISTYDDHRMAMAFAMLGAHVDGLQIEHPLVVDKSFPDFWDKLAELGIRSTS